MKTKYRLFFLVLIVISLFISCKVQPISGNGIALGTSCSITVYRGDKDIDEYFNEINREERLFSRNIDTSDISRVNKNAGIKKTEVSEETYKLVEYGLSLSRITDGAFNVAIGSLVDIWDDEKVPSDAEIQKALGLIDYNKVILTLEDMKYYIYLEDKGMQLDLGGIAKGYIAQKLGERIEEGIINLGGNIYVKGRDDDNPWKIGLQDPEKDRGDYFSIERICEGNVVTSGSYERYFIQDGIVYHHILDGSTGWPARGNVLSVSVIGPDGTTCDGLSTAFFVMGVEKTSEVLKRFSGYKCVFVLENHETVTLQ